MRNIVNIILVAAILFLFIQCSDSASPAKMKRNAIRITELIDDSTIETFHEWNYGERGDYGLWTKLAGDTAYYTCGYFQKKDTAYLRVYRPFRFVNDFPANYSFDTSKFWQFGFVEYKGRIIRVETVGHHGGDNFTAISQPVGQIFFKQNPFDKLASLTALKYVLGVHSISYWPGSGNFVEFWLSAQYKLTYLPDNLRLDSASKKFWEQDFAQGEMIKKNWNLRKVY
jgi:hypothetical protein